MMRKKLPLLNQVLLQLMLRRFFLPLLIVWIAAIGGAGYFLFQTLVYQQQQIVKSMTRMVDWHLDQGGRILDAVARVAETKAPEDITAFMQSTWAAYKHFDTIYYLDENHRIVLMVPSDPMYLGLDMSSVPDFQQIGEKNNITISRPFISLRTGGPTVYLVRPLSRGGCVVGELNLGAFQHEIISVSGVAEADSIFILDQAGTLLAHPVASLVKQQTNMSYLEIFRRSLDGAVTLVYEYAGTKFFGSATKVERVGWTIVKQIPLLVLLGPYAMTLGMTFLMTLSIGLTLVWNLRKQLQRNVVAPLVQLSHSTEALASGEYSKVSVLASMPTIFAEVNKLANDFQRMSSTLQARQAALRESEERYHSLFKRVPTGLFRLMPDGEIVAANQAYICMLGFPDRETLLGVNAFALYLSSREREQWQAVVEQEKVEYFETQMRRYDEVIIWVRIRCRAICENGRILYYDGSIEDITKQKYTEEALQQALDDLEIRVRSRTAALAEVNQSLICEIVERKYVEAQFKQKNQELEKAYAELKNAQSQIIHHEKMASIGQIAAAVAHEIRNPMTTVRGYLQFMERKQEYQADKERFELMIEEIDRANAIIREYLFLSREKVANMNNYSLNNIIEALFPLIEATANAAKVSVNLALADIPDLLLDENEIRQLLLNLVRNGIEAMLLGGELVICTFQEDNKVILSISDQGSGIPSHILSSLGTPFVTTKDVGTGLGLPICYQIVKRHNAEIKIRTSNQGTTFSIYFNLPS